MQLKIIPLVLVVLAMPLLRVPALSAPAKQVKNVQSIAGTYVFRTATRQGGLTIQPLKDGHMAFNLDSSYCYKDAFGDLTANSGTAAGQLKVVANTAIWKYGDDASLTFRFTSRDCRITQSGNPGFGAHVDASGSYRKTNKH